METEALSTGPDAMMGNAQPYSYPSTPFENIGFALSGGGFRAATFGLGTLSLMHHIKLDENGGSTLVEKIKFISSASGGTITLSAYIASLYNNDSFETFYHRLKEQMTGEAMIKKAVDNLKNDALWTDDGKSRNIINAFSLAYHDNLLSFLAEEKRTLGGIMPDASGNSTARVHVEEFCFNATEFYTGIPFRFQAGEQWQRMKGATLGNSNVSINWDENNPSIDTLKQVRLADVLAASSCFPLGFEPLVYPKDFTYKGGPSADNLKNAMKLQTSSWSKDDEEANKKSKRAVAEHEFATAGVFGLMDGGICDNQGLDSMIKANARASSGKTSGNRFDLMMVSDVTSYYMSPYKPPAINTNKAWMSDSPDHYWKIIQRKWKSAKAIVKHSWWVALLIAIILCLPLVLEGIGYASVTLAVIGIALFIGVLILGARFRRFLSANDAIGNVLDKPDLAAVAQTFLEKGTFAERTAVMVVNYLQNVRLNVLVQMGNARLQSAITMISEIFLKHIRRLIYDSFYRDMRYVYRRMDNTVYKLTYTNSQQIAAPKFEPRENEPQATYEARKTAFREEFNNGCMVTDEMKRIAELAYNTGTTLWFEDAQESAKDNNRKALIATGQFTTCYNLLGYTLSLKHSRHFNGLEQKYRDRVLSIAEQLKGSMKEFNRDPYYLFNLLEAQRSS